VQEDLTKENVVLIMISADFLRIEFLVKECLKFFVENAEELSKIAVDMSCINSSMVREIAKRLSVDRLELLKERKDKLVSRLFMKKLELLLEKDKNYLNKCAICDALFTKNQRKYLTCTKNDQKYIDKHG
jgi:hypothetical protein